MKKRGQADLVYLFFDWHKFSLFKSKFFDRRLLHDYFLSLWKKEKQKLTPWNDLTGIPFSTGGSSTAKKDAESRFHENVKFVVRKNLIFNWYRDFV